MEQRYTFSGSLSNEMVENLVRLHEEGKFKPMDALVSQLDKSGVKQMLHNMELGIVKSLFIDSGAYSVHSGKEKIANDDELKAFVDRYIDYINELDDKIFAAAQVDHIPGVFKQPKKPEDYVESIKLSWDNYMYMRPKVKSPEKLLYVFHQGESFDQLGKILEWKDDDGNQVPYVGISPSNDRSVGEKDIYLKQVYDFIEKTSNPNVHTHLFGYTSLDGLPKFPWYSADSTSHRLRPAYAKIFTRKWGVISMSKTRNAKTSSDRYFPEICDERTLKEFTELLDYYGFTIDQVTESSSARTAIDICETQQYVEEHPYKRENLLRSRKLFSL